MAVVTSTANGVIKPDSFAPGVTSLLGSDPEKLAAEAGFLDIWNQLLIEKFLMTVDNGWLHALPVAA